MPVVQGGATDPASRIIALVEEEEPRFTEAFLLGIATINDQTTLEELAELLQLGFIEEALASIGEASELLAGAYGDAVIDAGQQTAGFATQTVLTTAVAFNVAGPRALAPIVENRARIVSEFTNAQRAAVQSVLIEAVRRQLEPIETARLFKASIGLTANQLAAVQNFRRLLEEGNAQALRRALRDPQFDDEVRDALRGTAVLSQSQIDRMVEAFRRRSIRHRASTIARTESLRAVHEGVNALYEQVVDDGLLFEEQVVRRWVTAGDELVRGSHRGLNGLLRAVGETFPGLAGTLRFPGDPRAPASETVRCRCRLEIIIRELEEL